MPIYCSLSERARARNFSRVYISNFLKWKCCFVSIRNNLLDIIIYSFLWWQITWATCWTYCRMCFFFFCFCSSVLLVVRFCFHCFFAWCVRCLCSWFIFSLIRLWISHCVYFSFAYCVWICWVCKCVFGTNCWKRSNYSFQ